MFVVTLLLLLANYFSANCKDAAPEEDEAEDCDITSHVCKPSGLSVIKTFDNVTTNLECKAKCQQDANCNFVTFTNFRSTPKCYLLSECQDKVCISFMFCQNIILFKRFNPVIIQFSCHSAIHLRIVFPHQNLVPRMKNQKLKFVPN